jgi:hypothetical protein
MASNDKDCDALESIDLASLQAVTGGRVSRSSAPDPAVLQGIKQLAEIISAVGQNLSQTKAAGSQQMMQMMQQMMQARGGR